MVKFILFLLGGFLFVAFQQQTEKVAKLTGKILNASADFVVIGYEEERDTLFLASDGTFAFTKELESPDMFMVLVPSCRAYPAVFMENGKVSHIEIDVDSPQDVRITGDLEAVHDYLYKGFVLLVYLKKRPVRGFKEYERMAYHVVDSLLDVVQKLGDECFYRYETKYLRQTVDVLKTGYFNILSTCGEKFDSDPDYNIFMQSMDLNDEANLKNSNIFYYLQWKASCLTGSSVLDYYEMLKVLQKEVHNQQISNKLACQLARIYLMSGRKEHVEDVYRIAKDLLAKGSRKEIDDLYTKVTKSLKVNSLAPDFEMMTPEGKTLKFSEVWGKIVYIDIWSTWCAPCCKEIPYVAKLVEHYKNNSEIEFISISLDKNLKDWQSFLESHRPGWKQFVIPEKQQRAFLKLYGINGIPRFMVFTKEGRIIDTNAPRPSSENIMNYLDGILNP